MLVVLYGCIRKIIMENTVRFNPKFSEFLGCEKRYCVLYGGAGSGKSYVIAQKIVERCTHPNEKHKFLVLRKFRTTLEGSVFTLIKAVIDSFGISDHVNINQTKMSFTFSNGNEIIVSGLDDSEKLKSIHGITGVFVEEATEIEDDDFSQIDLRLRGETDSYKQIVIAFNPVSIDNWVYKRFFESDDEDVYKLHSNYKNNMFLDDQYIKVLESRFSYDPNLYRIYVLGEFGRERSNEEFYAMFNKDQNVKPVAYNPDIPIHLSFDFNISPYLPISLWQINMIDDVYHVCCFDLIAMENPLNNTEDACKEFMRRYPNYDLGVYIYGDVSGRARQTSSKVHNYDIIENQLKKYIRNWSMRVPTRNPSFKKSRRDFMNKCLAGGYDDIRIVIDPTCELMIIDMENVLTDGVTGDKYKKKFKNKAGVQYEKYGHFSDTMDYLLCSAFETKFRDFGRKLI